SAPSSTLLLSRYAAVRTMRVERHEHAEGRSPRKGFTFDDPAMVTDQLGHKCKSQARARDFRRNEGVEQIGRDFRRNAGAVVANAYLERQAHRLGADDRLSTAARGV